MVTFRLALAAVMLVALLVPILPQWLALGEDEAYAGDATHKGSWVLTTTHTAVTIFASPVAVKLFLTITKDPASNQMVSVEINGAIPANGGLRLGERTRSFIFNNVTVVRILGVGLTGDMYGEYQVTILP